MSTPAGWYSDPAGSGGHRYWDGAGWTDHVQLPQPAPAPQHSDPAPQQITPEATVGEGWPASQPATKPGQQPSSGQEQVHHGHAGHHTPNPPLHAQGDVQHLPDSGLREPAVTSTATWGSGGPVSRTLPVLAALFGLLLLYALVTGITTDPDTTQPPSEQPLDEQPLDEQPDTDTPDGDASAAAGNAAPEEPTLTAEQVTAVLWDQHDDAFNYAVSVNGAEHGTSFEAPYVISDPLDPDDVVTVEAFEFGREPLTDIAATLEPSERLVVRWDVEQVPNAYVGVAVPGLGHMTTTAASPYVIEYPPDSVTRVLFGATVVVANDDGTVGGTYRAPFEFDGEDTIEHGPYTELPLP